MVRFETKNTFKRLGTLMLALSLAVSSTGFTSLANYSVENENVGGSSGELLEEKVLTKIENDANYLKMDYSLMTDYAKAEAEINVESVYNEIATFSNATNIIAVVETEDELKNAIAVAGEGDIIEIANDIYLSETIHIDSSITLKAVANIESVLLYANKSRHFFVSGESIKLKTEKVILDGQNLSGGIYSEANNLILSNLKIYNCSNNHGNGGAIDAQGELTIIDTEMIRNTCSDSGGAVYASSDVTIYNCYINDNKAGYQGGAVSADSHFTGSASTVTIINSQFIGNESHLGGGLFIIGETTNYIADSIFMDNIAKYTGGGLEISDTCYYTHILDCDISNNSVNGERKMNLGMGGGIYTPLHEESVMVIENTKICGNYAIGSGGGIGTTNGPVSSSFDELLIISNCEITNNISMEPVGYPYGSGGGIYINHGEYRWLKICNNTIIKDNFANDTYQMTNIYDVMIHDWKIDSTTTWTDGFDYVYNNLDISYTGIYSPIHHWIDIEQYYADSDLSFTKHDICYDMRSYIYNFIIPEGYYATIEGDVELLTIDMDAGVISVESITQDIFIKIIYQPIFEETCTITLITHYPDGSQVDESKSYQVQKGTSFLESYEVLEGYTFAGMNIRTSYPEIDVNAQTIFIDSVEEDYIITINLTRKKLNVQITTQYMDGIIPDETKSYQVLYGDAFAESYDALEGYVFAGMSIRSYPYVDISNGTVCIDEVAEDYHIVIKLRRAEYKVKITVEYEGGILENQVSTYTVLHGNFFREKFEIADGYNIAIIKAEKGVDLDYFMQMVEIENVTKDMNVTIICR